MIQIRDLSYGFDGNKQAVLNSISLDIPDGARIAVVGPNGSGKTTFLRHLNGLLLPSKGEVLVDGLSTQDPRALPAVRQRVGMVFQNPDTQIVGMTVEEDVAFGPGNLNLPSDEIADRVHESLESVGLAGFEERVPHELSSGEKQLVAVAGVLAMHPRHILLDEPTAYLDPAGRRRVMEVIGALHGSGLTVIHVTHDMDEIVDVDRVLVMERGAPIRMTSPADLFREPEELRRLGLDVPVVARLMTRLYESGIGVRPDILTMDEAVEELTQRLLQ
ncbi:MAG: energy-coupling factor transporter ATPase [Thermodesulfobacteriota bacterium]